MDSRTHVHATQGKERNMKETESKSGSVWWFAIVAASTGMGATFGFLELPGGWLIGALLGALALSVPYRRHPTIPHAARLASQAVIGSFLASRFELASFASFGIVLLPMFFVVVVTLSLSVVLALLFSRVTKVDIETSILGLFPGGAAAMVAMSVESENADAKLVSFMQYIRLCIVLLVTGVLSHYLIESGNVASGGSSFGGLPDFAGRGTDYMLTPLITIAGAWIGQRLRVPAGTIVGPMVLCLVAKAAGLVDPLWLPGTMPAAYIVLGLYVGTLFSKESLVYAGKIAPFMMASTFLLIAASAATGVLLAWLSGETRLSAYLATTPGGMDSVAAIALSTEGANLSFVVTVQMMRMLTIVMFGPVFARFAMVRRGRKRT